jgi:hypothetical protein
VSGGSHVLVDQAVEDGFSVDRLVVEVCSCDAGRVAFAVGNVLGDALVWPGGVVVRLVFGQDGAQMLCVPKTSSMSCDQAIFVDQAASASLSSDAMLVEIDWVG